VIKDKYGKFIEINTPVNTPKTPNASSKFIFLLM
jgi:hypothetical protein